MEDILYFNDFTWDDTNGISLKDAQGLIGEDPTVIVIPEKIFSRTGDKIVNVTGILNHSFKSCPFVKKVIIPKHVKVEDFEFIFRECYYLEEVVIDSENEYYRCIEGAVYTKDLSMLIYFPLANKKYDTIPEGVIMKDYAFGIWPMPKTASLPQRFQDFYHEKSWSFDDETMSAIKEDTFDEFLDEKGNLEIPSQILYQNKVYIVRSIPQYSFQGKYKNITLPDSVEYIDEGAFECMESCESINLPKRLKTIGEAALFPVNNINKLELPPTLEFIGLNAFNCFKQTIKSIVIPKGISDASFLFTFFNLEEIELVDSINKEVNLILEDGVLLSVKNRMLIKYPTKKEDKIYKIPNGIESVLETAFKNNPNIEKVVMPDTISHIYKPKSEYGYHDYLHYYDEEEDQEDDFAMFKGCTSLQQVVFSTKINEITPDLLPPAQTELFIPKDCKVNLSGTNIQQITIEKGHKKYFLYEGCLYKRNEKYYNEEETYSLEYIPSELKIEQLRFVDGCRDIGYQRYYLNRHIKKILLPKSFNWGGYHLHEKFPSLETIEVEDGNSVYFVEDNCLFRRYEYYFHKKNNIEKEWPVSYQKEKEESEFATEEEKLNINIEDENIHIEVDFKYFISEPFNMLIRIDEKGIKHVKAIHNELSTWKEDFVDEETGEVQEIERQAIIDVCPNEFSLPTNSIITNGGDCAFGKVTLKPITKKMYESLFDQWTIHSFSEWENGELIWGTLLTTSSDIEKEIKGLQKMGYNYDFLKTKR